MTSCNLKGSQKLFFIQLAQGASCCRSHLEPLPADMHTLLAHWTQEHSELAQGNELETCSSCWKQEARGQLSYRQQFGHKNSNDIELWLSNACNQMCSYCSPKFSSTWEDSIKQHGEFKNISATAKTNLAIPEYTENQEHWIQEISEYLQQQPANSVNLKLLGGEPLMQIRNLQKLLELAGPSISTLEINSNLNPPSNKFLDWLVDSVPNHKLRFDVSLDATPSYNHIPRAGFDATKFEANLELLKARNIQFQLVSVISVLSVFDLPNFVQWAQPYRVFFSKINNPDCLDPIWLPEQFLTQIRDQFGQISPPEPFIELCARQQTLDLKLYEQYNYLCQYFSRTGIDPTKIDNPVFQQYWNWLNENRNRK